MIKKDGVFSGEGVTESERCIHTPSAFAKQNLMYVQEVGRLKSLKPHRCIRENLNSFLLIIVFNGSGVLNVNGKAYELTKGMGAFINCMEHYEHISNEQDGWKLAWVHFNGDIVRNYYELFMKYNRYEPIFHVENLENWNEVVDKLQKKQMEKSLIAELQCGEILLEMTNMLIENVSSQESEESEDERAYVDQVRVMLNEHYAEEDVLKKVEEQFGKADSNIWNVFQKHYGITIPEYISTRRFNVAKELLRFSIKSIEQVAKESGIESVEQMQRLFMENEGNTAEEYRMQWAQWIR